MNLIKSTSTYSFFVIISRILGYVRDLFIAIYLGSGPIADAFFVAFRIPNTFRRLFSEGTFNSAFVPSYMSELSKGKERARKFANNIFNFLVLSLLIVVLLIEIFMPIFILLIAPGFSDNGEKLQMTINLTRITFPFLLFISLSSFFSAILNSFNKFAIASAAPIILNIFLILTILYANYLNDSLVYYLSIAVTAAGLLQLFFLIFFSKNYFFPKFSLKIKYDKNIKFFFKKLVPSIFSSGVTQINILVGTIIASFQASAVSYLYYADRIYQINLAIAGIAIGTVLLPNLSKYVEQNNKKKIKFIQNKSLELSIFLSLPATFALLISSEEVTSALFGYGSFDVVAVKNSANALFYFTLGLPAFALIKVFSSYIFARQNTKTPFIFSIYSVFVNISISIYFFSDFGFIIIPIATTISSWFNAILLFAFLTRKNYFVFDNLINLALTKILISSIITTFLFYNLINYFDYLLVYESEFKLLAIISIVIITFFMYILISIFTKAFKISDIKLKY
ncbi:murein biosynthesis integral membrane protein MurJ [Candidatus Pelagibacter sp.]|nr:murein biosynthesis integral membrane protein MurJ [Candidatus Pelagibacter sp.]